MIEHIHPADLSNWLVQQRSHGTPVVLDVREPMELALASIKPLDFELLTIPMGAIVQRLEELDPERPIACLCHHGSRSMQVANYLQNRGFKHVANITGGINAWSIQLDPGIALY
ncbi:MAG: rhodanese-like domain-containing protein [Burkholderiaceae bacterium]